MRTQSAQAKYLPEHDICYVVKADRPGLARFMGTVLHSVSPDAQRLQGLRFAGNRLAAIGLVDPPNGVAGSG